MPLAGPPETARWACLYEPATFLARLQFQRLLGQQLRLALTHCFCSGEILFLKRQTVWTSNLHLQSFAYAGGIENIGGKRNPKVVAVRVVGH